MTVSSRALVRGVPSTYERCIRPEKNGEPINVELARVQHAAYCAALEQAGLELTRLDADDAYPDCCFIEDTVVLAGDIAVVCEMGASSRRGEQRAVVGALAGYRVVELEPPATLDGGDVISADGKMFVGLTGRTNESAVGQLKNVLGPAGIDVTGVPVAAALHLKSACTPLRPGVFLVAESFVTTRAFSGYEKIVVPGEESYASNCLSVNDTVIVSRGYPRTKALIEAGGFHAVDLDMSEFRKGGGSLTCLSVLL